MIPVWVIITITVLYIVCISVGIYYADTNKNENNENNELLPIYYYSDDDGETWKSSVLKKPVIDYSLLTGENGPGLIINTIIGSFNDTLILSSAIIEYTDQLKLTNYSYISNDNGDTWDENNLSELVSYNIQYNNGRWVAVGTGVNANMYYSDDGITWTAIPGPFGEGGQGRDISYNSDNGRWVVVGKGETDNMYYSDDGITWTAIPGPFGTREGNTVLYSNNRWVAGGYGETSNIYYSDDGITWVEAKDENINVFSISNNNDTWVVVGNGLTEGNAINVYYSNDNAETWKETEGNLFGEDYGTYVSFSNNNWIVSGLGGFDSDIYHSDDGIVWTAYDRPNEFKNSVKFLEINNTIITTGLYRENNRYYNISKINNNITTYDRYITSDINEENINEMTNKIYNSIYKNNDRIFIYNIVDYTLYG